MANTYEIFSDMAIDIDEDFAAKYDLKYIPMEYMLGEESFHITEPDSAETMEYFYEQLRNKVPTQTTQVNQFNYIQTFEPVLKEGKDILYLTLSGGLSSTYESACSAANALKEDYPDRTLEIVDSLSATVGLGLITESALLNREDGMSVTENAKWLRDHRQNVVHQFKVVDLFYLMRGGRVSAATAALGTALNLKPILIIDEEGHLETIAKKRGDKLAMKGLIERYEELKQHDIDPRLGKQVYICHSGCSDEAERYKEAFLAVDPELKIKIHYLSPVIGAHTGPDMIGTVFYAKSRR